MRIHVKGVLQCVPKVMIEAEKEVIRTVSRFYDVFEEEVLPNVTVAQVVGMEHINAKNVLRSINVRGQELHTVLCSYPRFIHAELMTHRVFSRNAASSRAIPVKTMMERIKATPASPIEWGQNNRGMQSHSGLSITDTNAAIALWNAACQQALTMAEEMNKLNVHKQIVNRLLEPFMFIETLITATEWDNFFLLRKDARAQPEIQELAFCMGVLRDQIEPILRKTDRLDPVNWHLPFITPDEYTSKPLADLVEISTARCARTSYLKADLSQLAPVEDDLILFNRLVGGEIRHSSPTEHQAYPRPYGHSNNLVGWTQYRELVDNGHANLRMG